jgi:hypothetical protein
MIEALRHMNPARGCQDCFEFVSKDTEQSEQPQAEGDATAASVASSQAQNVSSMEHDQMVRALD